MSNLKVNTITDASGGNTATINGATPTTNNVVGVNRIINGSMVFDQRNAGASVSVTSAAQQYSVDRFQIQCATDGTLAVQQSTTAPAGFTNSLLLTVSVADASLSSTQIARIRHKIEGFNTADLGFGAASASSVTISFWVRSSVTGTFAGYLVNSATNRSCPFTFTINAANTFEQKSVTLTGDTTGTWLTNNGIGIELGITLGAGSSYNGTASTWAAAEYYSVSGATNLLATSSATFYITGVQLEKGSVATAFQTRHYGQELALCQRYAWVFGNSDNSVFGAGYETSAIGRAVAALPVPMRASPTLSASTAASTFSIVDSGSSGRSGTAIALAFASPSSVAIDVTASGTTANVPCLIRTASSTASIVFSAEL